MSPYERAVKAANQTMAIFDHDVEVIERAIREAVEAETQRCATIANFHSCSCYGECSCSFAGSMISTAILAGGTK